MSKTMNPNETLSQIDRNLKAGDFVAAKEGCHNLAQGMCEGGFNPVWSRCPEATAYWAELSFNGEFSEVSA